MDIFEIFEKFGVVGYGLAILFGGIAGIKMFPEHWDNKYKFLLFSSIVAVIFIFLEVVVQKSFQPKDATKYLLTYCVVAVAYQVILKKVFTKWGWIEGDEIKP